MQVTSPIRLEKDNEQSSEPFRRSLTGERNSAQVKTKLTFAESPLTTTTTANTYTTTTSIVTTTLPTTTTALTTNAATAEATGNNGNGVTSLSPRAPRNADRQDGEKRTKLDSRRRSTSLPRKEKPIPYPLNAASWISEAGFARQDRRVQMAISALSAAREMMENGKKTFGDEWTWDNGEQAPLRNWGQRGKIKRGQEHEVEYFSGQASFEDDFKTGKLSRYMSKAIASVSALVDKKARTDAIRKLAKQAGHVLNYALVEMRNHTFRPDVKPAQLRMVWEAMLNPSRSEFDKQIILAYLSEEKLEALQAFYSAAGWLMEHSARYAIGGGTKSGQTGAQYGLATPAIGLSLADLNQQLFDVATSETDQFLRLAFPGTSIASLALATASTNEKRKKSRGDDDTPSNAFESLKVELLGKRERKLGERAAGLVDTLTQDGGIFDNLSADVATAKKVEQQQQPRQQQQQQQQQQQSLAPPSPPANPAPLLQPGEPTPRRSNGQ